MDKIKIRFAEENDSNEILDIYTPYILNTPITFEYDRPDEEEFKNRIIETKKKYPYLVCSIDNKIIGYAYASQYKNRKAYDYTAEISIYIKDGYKGKHIGQNLYMALIEILKLQNLKILYACITVHPTLKSSDFHKKLGFKEIGFFKNSGFKDGKWYDTAWYSLNIGDFEPSPKELIPIGKISKKKLNKIFQKYEEAMNQTTI